MERHESRSDYVDTTPSFPPDGGHHHHHDNSRHHQDLGGDPSAPYLNNNSNHSLPLSGQKRQFPYPNNVDYGGYVKLYVVGISRTAMEQDISEVFGEFGEIIEVVLLKDKRTGFQQECCFVKYATIEQAERAIGTLNGQYTFSGGSGPVHVKYAVGERERLGSSGAHVHKLYVGCLNRQAMKWEIEEIFTPFGVIEEVFIVRDEFKQSKGCAFVQFSCREMAVAAIQSLHGIYVMKGCDVPLIVRFADPKRPRVGESRPAPYLNDPANGYMLSNEMQQMKPSGFMTRTMSNSIAAGDMEECDWSEHVSPDGDLYYYNCVTCESRWEMPEEYAYAAALVDEQEVDIIDNLEEQQQQQQQQQEDESKLHINNNNNNNSLSLSPQQQEEQEQEQEEEGAALIKSFFSSTG